MTGLDDDIIELTDIAKKDSDLSTDDDVIELTDIAEGETTNLDLDIEKEDELCETPPFLPALFLRQPGYPLGIRDFVSPNFSSFTFSETTKLIFLVIYLISLI